MENFSNLYPYLIGYFILYSIILFFDTIFKTCMFYPYLSLMDELGLSIKPLAMTWSITKFNRTFQRIGISMPQFLKKWFSVGYYCTLLSLFLSVGYLVFPIVRYFALRIPENNSNQPVVSVIPGVTTPFYHVAYIIPALIINLIFHEFGHALAASREKVPISNCGFSLFLLFPTAFVNFPIAKLNMCTHKQKLRIYCAGVWHNIVLFLFGLLFVYNASFIFYPGLRTGSGVTIINVQKLSSLSREGGFSVHDVVTTINDCEVRDESSWYNCLAEIESSPQIGFCSSDQLIQQDEKTDYCCTNSSDHLCFKYADYKIEKFACLLGRKFIDQTSFCKNSSDCYKSDCLIPYLTSNSEKLIKFERKNKKSVLFIGSIEELVYYVQVSSWVSHASFPSVELAIHIENFLKYIAGIAAGLVVLNVIPCYYLDGGHIIENIVELYFKQIGQRSIRNIIIDRLKMIGFVLIIINVLNGISNLLT